MLQKAYKFRIYPNNTQKVLLSKTFGCCRYAWNSWVDNFKKTEDQVFKTPKDFKSELEWMKEVSSSAIQQKERDFQEFKNQFFNKARKKKLGRPQFKSKRNKQSYRLPNQKFSINGDRIRLEKIGFVKMVADRDIPKNVKFVNATISKDTCNDYYVSILVEDNIKPKEKIGKEVGIDVGLKSFAVLSDGMVVDNPKYLRENQPELKRIQHHLSRKVMGSNRYFRNKMAVSKFHRKIARRRSYFLHNLTSSIVSNYDVIAVEDLNISGMVKNHCLAKSIHDASWSEFFRQLSYKCEWYGKELRKSDRFEPTSKTCSVCGFYYKDFTLKIRDWQCPCCGTDHDRDANASRNILKKSAGVEAELQTRRGCKTSEDRHSKATPCEVSRVLLERNTFL